MADSKRSHLSRREFGRAAATAATLAVVPGWISTAEETKPTPPSQTAKPAAGGEEVPSVEATALAEIVRLRYTSRLDGAAVKEITRGIEGNLKSASTLRKIPLDNADEPAFVFRVWRARHD